MHSWIAPSGINVPSLTHPHFPHQRTYSPQNTPNIRKGYLNLLNPWAAFRDCDRFRVIKKWNREWHVKRMVRGVRFGDLVQAKDFISQGRESDHFPLVGWMNKESGCLGYTALGFCTFQLQRMVEGISCLVWACVWHAVWATHHGGCWPFAQKQDWDDLAFQIPR